MVKRRSSNASKAAEVLAIQALTFIAADAERLGRFLAISGIGPDRIRAASAEPNFLAGVLDYVAGDEELLIAFAGDARIDAREIARAQTALAGAVWERDTP